MKKIFTSNAAGRIGQDLNFSAHQTPWVQNDILGYSFLKEKWGAINIVNFTDADNIEFNNIEHLKLLLNNELSSFKSLSSNAVIYYKVFITSQGLADQSISDILGLFSHSIVLRSTFIPVIIDLSMQRILSRNEPDLKKVGLYQVFEQCLLSTESEHEVADFTPSGNNAPQEQMARISQAVDKSSKPVFTYLLILINIFMFIIMEYAGGTNNPAVLKTFGIKINSLIIRGEYWRLITSAFIHIGLAHIAFNMYGLFNLGGIVERIYGNTKFAFIYLAAAVSGSIASFIFSPAASAGASGAIFGLFGALLYLGRKIPKLFSTSFGMNILTVLGFNLIYGFINTGIDNFAHIGGLIGGYLAASAVGLKGSSKK